MWRFVGWGTAAGGVVGAALGVITFFALRRQPDEIFGHGLDHLAAILMAALGIAGGGLLGAVVGAFAAGGAVAGWITLGAVAAGVAAAVAAFRWIEEVGQGLAILGIGPIALVSAPFLAGLLASRLAGRRRRVTRAGGSGSIGQDSGGVEP
ncbi:MAG TPA: hypothetical protein VFS92_01460 [Planctomycetota bacterium]|nr:hypothetical protein [Planctomycetota bacterium]